MHAISSIRLAGLARQRPAAPLHRKSGNRPRLAAPGAMRVKAIAEAEKTLDSTASVIIDNSSETANTLILIEGSNKPGACQGPT